MNNHITTPRYQFSEIPNDDEGREFIRLARKYLNRDRYTLRVKGQHLKPELNWRYHQFGQGIKDSTHLRVYINDK
jgi:hypothetical protein